MPKYTHIMLDLETLSTRKDAAIIQIAAVAFDPETGEISSSFNAFIRNPSGHVDVPTVAWWMQQAQAATLGAAVAASSADDEWSALGAFSDWLECLAADAGSPAAIEALWSHGATFDIVVLENAYNRRLRAKPWSYKIERDTRTLYAVAPGGCPAVPVDPQRKHDARYDCEVQVKQVVGALQALRYVAARAEQADSPPSIPPTERAVDDFGHSSANDPGFNPASQF